MVWYILVTSEPCLTYHLSNGIAISSCWGRIRPTSKRRGFVEVLNRVAWFCMFGPMTSKGISVVQNIGLIPEKILVRSHARMTEMSRPGFRHANVASIMPNNFVFLWSCHTFWQKAYFSSEMLAFLRGDKIIVVRETIVCKLVGVIQKKSLLTPSQQKLSKIRNNFSGAQIFSYIKKFF